MDQQLVLDLQLRESYTFNNFIVGENKLVIELLKQFVITDNEKQLFIWGEKCIGKSHLLQAVCQSAGAKQLTVSYLPLEYIDEYRLDVLDGLENIDLVCVDDIQYVANKPEWQEKLFDLINRMREKNRKLLFSANLPPNELQLDLEDLRSRLNWGPVLQIKQLSDDEKKQALQSRAQSRGFELPDPVADFMLKNYSRDLAALFEKLEKLDEASLVQQRRLTIPFVKTVVEIKMDSLKKI